MSLNWIVQSLWEIWNIRNYLPCWKYIMLRLKYCIRLLMFCGLSVCSSKIQNHRWEFICYSRSLKILFYLLPLLWKGLSKHQICFSDEAFEKVNNTLALFKGTKNFHNFTSGKLVIICVVLCVCVWMYVCVCVSGT